MRRLLKFLHTVGAAGLTGSAAAMAIVLMLIPMGGAGDPMLAGMAKIAAWVLGPSMLITVIAGLLAMAANPAYLDVGWVWAKLATGILIIEGSLHILGPLDAAAKRSVEAVAASDAAGAARLFSSEANTLWIIFGVSIANIALGVWRPRFPTYRVK